MEQRACNKCKAPCCVGDFKQVVGLKNSGLLIYVPQDTDSAEQKVKQNKKDFFILHNSSDKEIKRPDYIKEMSQYRTKCAQCREFILRVRNLLDEITNIKQNEVISVCGYCKRLNPYGNCKGCEYFVNKFKCCQATQQREKNQQFLSWLHKVNALIQSILECKNVCTSRLYNEPSPYLNELVKLVQDIKPPVDLDRPDVNLLPKVIKIANDARLIEILEEILLQMNTGTLPKMLKFAYDNKISPRMEYGRKTFMETLAKNQKKLEELLLKMKHDTDVRLLFKMLEYADVAQGETEIEQSTSIEFLAKHKKKLEELLLKMKYDRMMKYSREVIDKQVSSTDTFPELKIKTSESKAVKKENVFKKFIQVMSQKNIKEDESKLEATVPIDNTRLKSTVSASKIKTKKNFAEKQAFKKLKSDLSKGKHGKRGDSFNAKSLGMLDSTNIHKELELKVSKKKKHGSKVFNLKDFVDGETKNQHGKKHDPHDMLKIDEKKRHPTRSKTQDLADRKVADKDKIDVKKIKLQTDSLDDLKFVTIEKSSPKVIRGTTVVRSNYKWQTLAKVTPELYKQEVFQELDQSDLPQIYNPRALVITDVDKNLAKEQRRIRSKPRLLEFDATQEHTGYLYQLSDPKFIRKGWTLMPRTKTLRKIRVFKMEPALPQYDWFENNKEKKVIFYDSGEKLAEIDDDGHGRWFYKSGEIALDFYNTDDSYGGQRYVLYSRGNDLDVGKSVPRAVLASFDYRGNGVVYDRYGSERLKYNQFEGALYDEKIGPTSRWKWHSLNEPPELNDVIVENYVKHIDPGFKEIFKKVKNEDNPRKSQHQVADPELLAIEYEHYIKHETQKRAQKFKPFKIRMKALKINDNFSLRVLGQANIHVLFREGPSKLRLNVGMNLLNEVIDTEIIEMKDVVTPYEHLPPLSHSLENIQNSIYNAKKEAKLRAEKTERLIMPPKLSRSAYKLGIGIKEWGPCPVQEQMSSSAFQMPRGGHD